MVREGNSSPPWLTKYAGPVRGTGRSGVMTLACPTIDSGGQPAGFDSKTFARHAFWRVFSCEGSWIGRSTLTFVMFAWVPIAPGGSSTFAVRLAPFALEVFAAVETENFG